MGVNPISAKNEKSGMFYHLHYFKFKPEVSEIEIAELMKELAALQNKISVLKEFWVGKNDSPNGKGFQYGEVALFEKKEDLKINKELYFSRYNYICDEGIEYNILKNQSKKGYRIPEHKAINYFLVTESEINKDELIKQLRDVKEVLLAFDLDKKAIKQIDRLIF